jgi:hypothetical protein
MIEKARAAGASVQELATQREQIERLKAMFANPIINIAITLLEPLPIGLLVTLISAAILRRKEPKTTSSESVLIA